MPNEYADIARQAWNNRNLEMAKNIANQIRNSHCRRNIVIVGAGQVISLRDMLKQVYPELIAKTL